MMRKVGLGTAEVMVSDMCLGALPFGTSVNRQDAFRMLDMYVDAGGSFIDTANMYSHWLPGGRGGDSEEMLGEWLRARGSRGDLFIASKVGFDYPGVKTGLSAVQIKAECDKSLRRLGVDCLDLYYAHTDDRVTPADETLRAFDALVRAGKVRYLGASNYRAWRLERFNALAEREGLASYCCIQQRYTYLRPHTGADFGRQVATNDDLLDWVARTGSRLLAYTPTLSGHYAKPDAELPAQYRGPDSEARMAALQQVAAEVGAAPIQVVYAWMRHSEPAVIPLVAATRVEHMAQNLAACEIALTAEQMARLDGAASA